MTTAQTHITTTTEPQLFGLMAEFLQPEDVVAAAKRAYEAGYREMEAYSPMPVEDLAESMGFTRNRMPLIVLVGGIVGGLIGFFMQWYSSVIDYPLNIGGRPYNSWPSYIPITFEMTVLVAALSAVIGMLSLNGLPRPYHPVFNVPDFALASDDRFFLLINAHDRQFDPVRTRQFLEGLGPKEISEVQS